MINALLRLRMLLALVLASLVKTRLKKPRRRRQQERHKTIGLIIRSIALHVRLNFLYIYLLSSAKQQRQMTKFTVLWKT